MINTVLGNRAFGEIDRSPPSTLKALISIALSASKLITIAIKPRKMKDS